jgi:putative endopeptidase
LSKNSEKRGRTALLANYWEKLGKTYVKRYFPDSRKAEVKKLIDFVLVAYRRRIEKLALLDSSTAESCG